MQGQTGNEESKLEVVCVGGNVEVAGNAAAAQGDEALLIICLGSLQAGH